MHKIGMPSPLLDFQYILDNIYFKSFTGYKWRKQPNTIIKINISEYALQCGAIQKKIGLDVSYPLLPLLLLPLTDSALASAVYVTINFAPLRVWNATALPTNSSTSGIYW